MRYSGTASGIRRSLATSYKLPRSGIGEARPRAVSKTAIKRALWPDAHVGAGSLTVLVAEVGTGLGDDARHPGWIRTVFRYGYAFAGEAADEAVAGPGSGAPSSRPVPRVVWGRRTPPLVEGDNVLGRDEDVSVRLGDVVLVFRSSALSGATATAQSAGER